MPAPVVGRKQSVAPAALTKLKTKSALAAIRRIREDTPVRSGFGLTSYLSSAAVATEATAAASMWTKDLLKGSGYPHQRLVTYSCPSTWKNTETPPTAEIGTKTWRLFGFTATE